MTVLLVRALAQDELGRGLSVPARIEDNDLAEGREMRAVVLHEQLGIFALGAPGQMDVAQDI